LSPAAAFAQEEEPETGTGISPSIFTGKLYGFIEARFEKSAKSPIGPGADGNPVYVENPHVFDVPALHVMIQALILDRFRVFVNLATQGAGEPSVDEASLVRNAWVELPFYESYFNLRIGKTYRRFGLYNEQLDAVPNFPGIEPPELFDSDHLMLTRTTNLMIHGSVPFAENSFSYALMTGNDERQGGQFPIGADLHFDIGTLLRLGSSFYTTNGFAAPTRDVGEGSPNGGVINWMETDRYYVYGGYGQLTFERFLLQAEFWQAQHDGRRDPAKTILLDGAELIPQQRTRFFGGAAMPSEADVVVPVKYRVQTFYARAAYEIPFGDATGDGFAWSITPYAQFDYYKNPETIRIEDFGGDNEAGIADDGLALKLTVGGILRPISSVAFKIDLSDHIQKVGGEQTGYVELRLSFAYYWEISAG
jgi:hypothetical protein